MSGLLEVRGVGKDFPIGRETLRVLDGVDFAVAPGEFVSLVGASGSGKSTLLSLIAGLNPPTAGQILLNGTPVVAPGPDRGLVLQRESLFPWRTVERNVGFGLELLPVPRPEREARVDWYLREVGMSGARKQLPKQLSGGQKQRVAIARALACEPDVLLLDEPFGALDVQTKEDMQVFLRRVWAQTGITVVMVTHDVEEAVFCSQRVLVLASDPGRIAEEMPVDLPDERDLTVKRSARFLELRARAEDLVRAQHRAHLSRQQLDEEPGPEPGGYPGPESGGYPGPESGGYPGPESGGYPGPEPGGYPGAFLGDVAPDPIAAPDVAVAGERPKVPLSQQTWRDRARLRR